MKKVGLFSLFMLVIVTLVSSCKKETVVASIPTTGSTSINIKVSNGIQTIENIAIKTWNINLGLYPTGATNYLQTITLSQPNASFNNIQPGNYNIDCWGTIYDFNGTSAKVKGTSTFQVQAGQASLVGINIW
jgi:type II secretory pathway pseudopilin PulG